MIEICNEKIAVCPYDRDKDGKPVVVLIVFEHYVAKLQDTSSPCH